MYGWRSWHIYTQLHNNPSQILRPLPSYFRSITPSVYVKREYQDNQITKGNAISNSFYLLFFIRQFITVFGVTPLLSAFCQNKNVITLQCYTSNHIKSYTYGINITLNFLILVSFKPILENAVMIPYQEALIICKLGKLDIFLYSS